MQGTFQPKAKQVTVWPPPSVDGDGEEVKVQDDTGQWITKEDPNGKPLRHHSAPDGFTVQQARNETGTVVHEYAVKTDERGNVVRDQNGNALTLPEGGAAVVHGDGSHETIPPEGLRDFLNSHDQIGD